MDLAEEVFPPNSELLITETQFVLYKAPPSHKNLELKDTSLGQGTKMFRQFLM
jgi:hypothetical protein